MLTIDLSSAKLSASKGQSAARVHAGSEYALMHCTTNVNLSVADGTPGRPTAGNMITFSGEIAFNADPASQADRNELLMDWEFLFLQTSETISNEYEYAGRIPSEGSVRVDLRPGFVPNPCLDADETLTSNFPFLQNGSQTTTPVGGTAARYVVTIEAGDNPYGMILLQGQNLVSKATNLLFRVLREEHFTTLFLARNLKKRQTHFLAHQKWSVLWDAELRWGFAGPKRPTNLFSSIDVDPTSVAGAPADAKVLAIMRNPQKPTANELDARATKAAFGALKPPLFQAFAGRHIPVPSDFFENLIATP